MVLENRLFKLKEIDNIRPLPPTMHKNKSDANWMLKYENRMSMFLEESLIIPNNHEDEEKGEFS